jgi:hypothetical protein
MAKKENTIFPVLGPEKNRRVIRDADTFQPGSNEILCLSVLTERYLIESDELSAFRIEESSKCA